MSRLLVSMVLVSLLMTSATPIVSAQVGQPDIIQEHWYHSYATLTLDLNEWADDYPEIVMLLSVGQTELGRELWMLQISDWSKETKEDGTKKDVAYIDGGHHGNEHLGTELAFLTAQFYIEGWSSGDTEVFEVLSNTELHILIMLNADGNDFDTRWNVNQVDLNRNYDHYWNTCPTTQPGRSAFSESETAANAEYMNSYVTDADLYVTMHTGVWIILYPWGNWASEPSDWVLFHGIRDEVHANISDIPIQNANQGLYTNCGTSRDYGYGVMGFPTFTFETDDEQFIPGSFESLEDRLDEEMDVMRYLINNVWYWRARLNVTSMEINEGIEINLNVKNLGHATTSNATIQYVDDSGSILWSSSNFSVNATNSSNVKLDASNLTLTDNGNFELYYQKRVIDSSQWVNENISDDLINIFSEKEDSFLGGSLIFDPTAIILVFLLAAGWNRTRY